MTTYSLVCDSCGRNFDAARPDAVTCGPTCRQRRYREGLAANVVKAATELLHRQTRTVIAFTSTDDDLERARLRRELDAIAAEAADRWPAAA
ncbi:hypothetical protein GCM10022200_05270 [Microbacterium awajiense]|uniref:Regulatory protein FmdB Zinc ribbon domain-containing protein n=1 Tax=Microbacterium awajiense TaxID=415214 RepID=A0ABP7A6J0_9MICO